MNTLYITDLDGTLLNSETKLSKITKDTINQLIEEGMEFTYATARSYFSTKMVNDYINLKNPLILHNGSFIFDPVDKQILSAIYFSKEEILTLAFWFHEHGYFPMVYSMIHEREHVTYYTGNESEGLFRYLSKRTNDPRMNPLQQNPLKSILSEFLFDRTLYKGNVFCFLCIDTYERLNPLHEELKEFYHLYTIYFQKEIYTDDYWLQIMPKEATKAKAIDRLREILQCERIVTFGDAINDISMFQVSDECYAMANGVEELKQIATKVISDNDSDGVALWLKEHAKKTMN